MCILLVAVNQQEVAWLNLDRTLNKTCPMVEEAAKTGANRHTIIKT
jgi:predicted amidohydrolase